MRILITRPEPEASQLAKLMEPMKAQTVPLLEIRPLDSAQPAIQGNLIFVSKNAARFYQGSIQPAFALGAGTASVLEKKGFKQVTYPKITSGSEAFLMLHQLQNVTGQVFTIIRGSEGRDLIETTLKQRGAIINRQIIYETTFNQNPDLGLLKNQYDLMIVTSTHALRYLAKLLQTHNPNLFKVPVTTLAGNMLKSATELGFSHPQIVKSFDNEYLRHLKPNPHSC